MDDFLLHPYLRMAVDRLRLCRAALRIGDFSSALRYWGFAHVHLGKVQGTGHMIPHGEWITRACERVADKFLAAIPPKRESASEMLNRLGYEKPGPGSRTVGDEIGLKRED